MPTVINGTTGVSQVQDSTITTNKIIDGTITNADISNTAAILGTKIIPEFGNQLVYSDFGGRLGRPSNYWGGTYYDIDGHGSVHSRGNFEVSITSNGYRSGTPSTNTTWTGLSGANNTAFGASQISLNPTGYIVFATDANKPTGSTNNPTERMRIDSDGIVQIGKTASTITTEGVELFGTGAAYFTRNGQQVMYINRLTNDGTLIDFRQDNIIEGSITVAGATVSYNGAHLSRWSQLPSGERQEILRGTVLSNIDEMCSWGNEINEQLNKMKVSDVEGDPNVAGVFQSWDDDDDTYTNDFYCAMTGDFIIRISQNATVQRGDLLMSAGDGTAKPQGDDIIRSKTIAKVTSTHAVCTYEDGSYCVPCVLMAC